jgi:hypothetical protein
LDEIDNFRAGCETNPIKANQNRGWRAGIEEMFHRRARAAATKRSQRR